MRIRELKCQLVSKNSEFEATAEGLESTERLLRFLKNAVSLMQEKVQFQGLWARKVKGAPVIANVAQRAAGSNGQ